MRNNVVSFLKAFIHLSCMNKEHDIVASFEPSTIYPQSQGRDQFVLDNKNGQ